jgi:phosphatidylserine decarboxylase
MTMRSMLARLTAQEDLNFLLTNRIPRRLATQLVGWLSKVEQPLVRDISIGLWRLFSDLDLSEARKTRFKSMHDCFVRELRDGARPIDQDPQAFVSPCDAIVGACGPIAGTRVLQVKGFPYELRELLGGPEAEETYRDGQYVTLRLTSGMYHRFHAPHDCQIEEVTYISGDTWNVNPIALKRIEKLFCKNERALIRTRLNATGHAVMLVPVAAILVASIRLHCVNVLLNMKYRGPNVIPCDAAYRKGDELGWFEHGSTIIVLAPAGFRLCAGIEEGTRIRMGEPLLRLP